MAEPDHHTLSGATLDAIADGFGGSGAIAELWRGQRSRRLLTLKLAYDRLPPGDDRADAVAAIVRAERAAPAVVRELLADPMVALWSVGIVGSARRGGAVSPVEAGHLSGIAVAAALRAGTDADLWGFANDAGGWLSLPAIGRIRTRPGAGRVRLTAAGGRLCVDGRLLLDGRLCLDGVERADDDPDWQRARTLTAGADFAVRLEDVDPHRDVYHVPAADRLNRTDFEAWRRSLDEAWRILTLHAPARAAEMAAGLRAMVPLRNPSANAAHSATARDAIGVIGLDLPATAADFAVTLVHEFQHSKLSGVLDIVELFRPSDRLFFAPWRTDARPVGGLFQGVYAFIAVADTWRALSADPAAFPQAYREFADARAQVSDALQTLAGSGLLTRTGERFLAGMRGAVGRLHDVEVPRPVEALAERMLAERRTAWLAAAPPG